MHVVAGMFPRFFARFRGAGRWAMAFMAGAALASAQESRMAEYQIKAVFLFNFAHFVEWPADAFPSPQAPLIIGVLGADPFGPYLAQAISGETANRRSLVLQHFREVEDITACHILYISSSESPRLDRVLSALKGRSILTVGEEDGFVRRGGVVRFRTENNKIRFSISLDSARDARLSISSKLLRTAEVIGADSPR